MPEMPITFLKGDSVGQETDYRDALPVNMYGISRPMFGAAGYMMQFSGLTLHASGTGKDRGGLWNERASQHYRVSGSQVISVSADGQTEGLGAIAGASTVSLPYSFNSQGIVADGKFYLLYPSGTLTEVTDSDLGSPIDCVWVDGYYFFTDGENIYHTDIDDETSIDPLKFATAEFMPDKSLAVAKTQDNKVMVFGRYTIEYFVNVASDNFAFQRVATRGVKIGIVGTHCKAESSGNYYILGGRKEESVSCHVVAVGGAKRVASREVDKVISTYSEASLSSAVVEAFEEDGYNFVVYHLSAHTLLFNETLAQAVGTESAWSILKTDVTGDNPWRGIHAVFDPRLAKWVFGDRRNENIGILDNESALSYGEISEWLLYTPFVYLDSGSIDELEVETMPGHTGTDDATVFCSLTYNGVTYGKEWTELYGDPNDYGKRFVVRRLGYVRDWVGLKLRGATRSRMAFGRGFIRYG